MAKAVATIGDAQPSAGKKDPTGASKGTWDPDSKGVQYKSYEELLVGGQKVIYEASMTWTYNNGQTPKGDPFPPQDETVTVKADTTVLQSGESKVLLDGKSEKGSVGENELKVQTSNHLSTD